MEPETVVRRSSFLCAQSQRTVLFSAEFSNGTGTFLFQNDVQNIYIFFLYFRSDDVVVVAVVVVSRYILFVLGGAVLIFSLDVLLQSSH